MNEAKFNVLLYSNESQHDFWGVIYSAILLTNMPNMHLTIVQLKESNNGSMSAKDSWINSWSISPSLNWIIDSMGGSDSTAISRYNEILTKTNEVFFKRSEDISYQVIYCNPSIPEAVDALLEYTRKKSIALIVMGTQRLTTLKDLIFGSLEQTLQNKSPIPVLLVKNLPLDFPNSMRSKTNLKVIRK